PVSDRGRTGARRGPAWTLLVLTSRAASKDGPSRRAIPPGAGSEREAPPKGRSHRTQRPPRSTLAIMAAHARADRGPRTRRAARRARLAANHAAVARLDRVVRYLDDHNDGRVDHRRHLDRYDSGSLHVAGRDAAAGRGAGYA